MTRPLSQIRCGNRIIQQKQDTLSLQKHYQSLRRARPMTGKTVEGNIIMINNKKREMVQQNRFTEIERQNRILFQKITSIMHKGTISQTLKPQDPSQNKLNKTLNAGYRKKQMQNIQFENAKLLKRLKQKKSSYGVDGLNRDWQKKKKMIKNMSLYPFILNDNVGAEGKQQRSRVDNLYFSRNNNSTQNRNVYETQKQLRRIRKINGFMFLITIKFESGNLFIIGDIKEQQSIKVIQLQKEEAEEFITEECNGNVENILNLLKYDSQSGDLYLVGKSLDSIQQAKSMQIIEKRRLITQHDKLARRRINSSVQHSHLPPRPLSKGATRKNINKSLQSNNEQQQEYTHQKKTTQMESDAKELNEVAQKKKNQAKNVQASHKQVQEQKKQSLWVKIEKKQEQKVTDSHERKGNKLKTQEPQIFPEDQVDNLDGEYHQVD